MTREDMYNVIKKVMESTKINEGDKVFVIKLFLNGWYTDKQIDWLIELLRE